MAIFKCKMCGGTVEFAPGATVGECDSCGTKQTLPRLDDERRANLYDRANHLLRTNEYDKAMGIYETILAEDTTDAEAYWSLVLCRYGVEYVEDPQSRRRVPTVNRAQYTSVLADEDYKSAIRYADALQRGIYEAEAKAIDDIQKGILKISQQEEPFDVFICYKETDENGRRTPDSVLATELYHELTKAGYKVFFSRITLEDKLGTAYEPYIFAALHSAKVMVVLGTKPEYFNAVWVRNEWSRYLALIQSGEKKTLIPAYKDMDPYDLPEAFSHLQAQDMSKLGFMQDLLHGVKKIIGGETKPAQEPAPVVVQAAPVSVNVAALMDRGFLALEDGEWGRADGFFEEALNQDARNAACYLGKLMAELRVRKREDLKNVPVPFDDRHNCQKASRFDAEIAKELADANAFIRERNENARKENIYQNALAESGKNTEAGRKEAARLFRTIAGYKDADKLAEDCMETAEKIAQANRKYEIYTKAENTIAFGDSLPAYEKAAELFESIPDYRDAGARADECRRIVAEKKQAAAERAEAVRAAAARRRSNLKKAAIIVASTVSALTVILLLLIFVILPAATYNKAVKSVESGDYVQAYQAFASLGKYKDAAEKKAGIRPQYYKAVLAQADVGTTVFYGAYEQNNDTSDGKEDVEWIVLDKQKDRVLMISKYALDCQPYTSEKWADVTWETCTLRTWLNETFLTDAFSAKEQERILTTTVTADANTKYDTAAGNDTKDKVFLLSVSEAENYFGASEDRRCAPTEHAKEHGVWANKLYLTSDRKAACWWWLRSPGINSRCAAGVSDDGDVNYMGRTARIVVLTDGDAVRPAMWIKTN